MKSQKKSLFRLLASVGLVAVAIAVIGIATLANSRKANADPMFWNHFRPVWTPNPNFTPQPFPTFVFTPNPNFTPQPFPTFVFTPNPNFTPQPFPTFVFTPNPNFTPQPMPTVNLTVVPTVQALVQSIPTIIPTLQAQATISGTPVGEQIETLFDTTLGVADIN